MALATEIDSFRGTERFEIRRRLGAGAFGAVYEAYDRDRGVAVALKTLREANVEALFRLKQEFRALADIRHPNLASLHELLTHGEQWFFTMEFVPGVNFLEYVRRGLEPVELVRPDDPTSPTVAAHRGAGPALSRFAGRDERLRAALRQVVQGIQALHRAGKLHRDIKPSNVLVTADGRVVLLDFGLVLELHRTGPGESRSIVGTPAYMSPEQGTGRPVSEASDWYSLGVMLYEALTGTWPFSGCFAEMMWNKRHLDAPAPADLTPGVPQDLNDLCRDLLRSEPRARPSGDEILARLGTIQAATFDASTRIEASVRTALFVGRRQELAALASSFEASQEGRAVVVRLHGVSGTGKTALARHFLSQLRRENPVILAGRCYEREAVPYKALDSLVDSLSQYLRALASEKVDAILPRDVLALARLFPVLRRVPSIAGARRRVPEIPDSKELRRRAFAALRELLARLVDLHEVVLFLDDLQWGDVDSAALLIELLRPPNPPPLLLIACYRSDEAATSPFLQTFLRSQREGPGVEIRELGIGRLTDSESRDLVRGLLAGESMADGSLAESIARESGGNPFFIDALVRYSQAGVELREGGSTVATLSPRRPEEGTTLERLIRSRVEGLPEDSRRLFEIVVVAGHPIALDFAKKAAELPTSDAVDHLRTLHLIRARAARDCEEIEPYHDRIREIVLASLSPEHSRNLHGRLAAVLQADGGCDPATLALHFQEAADLEQAAEYSALAAEQASEALAFERAARLFRAALELGGAEGEKARHLRVRLGEALANAGRGAESAKAFLAGVAGATAAEALELKRRAAEQLVASGHLDEGLPLLESIVFRMGFRIAAGRWRTIISFLFRRALLRLRGLEFRERDVSQISAEELIHVDTCWTLSIGFSNVNPIRGKDFQTRHLLLALRAGEPYRIALALANEAGYSATDGWPEKKRTELLVQRAMDLARRVGHPHAIAMAYMAASVAAHQEGRWKAAWDLAREEVAILRDHCTGVAWELDFTHIFSLRALFYLGEVKELSRQLPVLMREARERDDLLAVTSLQTRHSYLPLLAADEPAKALQELRKAIEQWSHEGFHSQHYWAMMSEAEIFLFLARPEEAWRVVSDQWRGFERSRLSRVQLFRVESLHLRARVRLAVAAGAGLPPGERASWLRAAERDARRIDHERLPWGNPLAGLLHAGLAAARGEREGSVHALQDSEREFAAADMALHAAVARRRRGELVAGEEGRGLVEAADAWMAGQEIRNPRRTADMIAPGFS